ncbi:hypothetical protein [Desertibacillus haloalkaliphilus]|uniref:hypothetical protein n=1 Tax=Desertibacillus haloalkaliphilus TaxID=1328930 RepID=UPI001C27469D|nr:hypothetical protein [Desertibacillus haloalkaliphilus]MBU8906367.1 hypothetical protein [Desertibacillus haloalkaliphilus]
MSVSHYYDLCHKNVGRAVEIKDVRGKVYRGHIERVDYRTVYLRPLDGAAPPPPGGPGGYGTFFWGPGFAAGALIGIGLGSIATLAFLPRPFIW